MQCPFCGENDDKVIDSRSTEAGRAIRRRRVCNRCDKRFTTYEKIEETIRLTVVKRDGTRTPYDRQKVLKGLRAACYKRPISEAALEQLVDDFEEELFKTFDREVESVDIGKALADRLKRVDQVAYVRFASIYKQFRDLDDLLDEVREIIANVTPDSPGQGKLFIE